ncbi:hypothetical protein [Arthrobacter sp. D3-16]
MADRFQDMPPKMRRFLRVTTYLATPIMVIGVVLGTFVDFRLIVIGVALVAIAVFVPLGIAANREKNELAKRQGNQEDTP